MNAESSEPIRLYLLAYNTICALLWARILFSTITLSLISSDISGGHYRGTRACGQYVLLRFLGTLSAGLVLHYLSLLEAKLISSRLCDDVQVYADAETEGIGP